MFPNPFYTSVDFQAKTAPCGWQKKHSRNYDCDFYFFSFEINQPSTLRENETSYQLFEHHISVYENFNPVLNQLSECHYTATYQEKSSGETYKLHIYFNGILSLLSAKLQLTSISEQRKELSSENQEKVKMMASICTIPLISNLRKKMDMKIIQIENECEQLNALCVWPDPMTKVLLQNNSLLLQQLVVNYEEALNWIGIKQIPHYKAKLQIIKSILLKTSSLIKDFEYKELVFEQLEHKEPVAETNVGIEPAGIAAYQESKVRPLLIELQVNYNRYPEIDQSAPLLVAGYINALVQQCNVIEIADIQEFNLNEMQQFSQLQNAILMLAKRLFNDYLLRGEIDAVECMNSLHHLLGTEHLNNALSNADTKYLSFLIRRGDFDFNLSTINVDSEYYSPLGFCLKEAASNALNAERLKRLAECYKLLILSPDCSISFLHTEYIIPVITDEGHPFYQTLAKLIEQLWVENPEGYSQFCGLIKACALNVLMKELPIERLNIKLDEKKLAGALLSIYTNLQPKLDKLQLFKIKKQRQDFLTGIEALNQMIPEVMADPDCRQLEAKIAQKHKTLLELLAPLERHKLATSELEKLQQRISLLRLSKRKLTIEDERNYLGDKLKEITQNITKASSMPKEKLKIPKENFFFPAPPEAPSIIHKMRKALSLDPSLIAQITVIDSKYIGVDDPRGVVREYATLLVKSRVRAVQRLGTEFLQNLAADEPSAASGPASKS